MKITNANGERPVLWLYEDIGAEFGGISADEFRQDLSTVSDTKPIDLRINSGGGIFTESIAIYTNLRQRKGGVNVFVDGLAASGASIVAMAGTTIEMAQGAWLMIHEARALGEGTADEMRKAAERLEATNNQLVSIYQTRWKGDEDGLRSALAAETWLTESEAVESGLADHVAEAMAVAAKVEPGKFDYLATPKVLVEGYFPRLRERSRMFDSLCSEKENSCVAN